MFSLSSLFISAAYAADAVVPEPVANAASAAANAALPGEPSEWIRFLPIFLIFIVIYVLMIRPQQKTLEAQSLLLKALKKGDKVVTGGGLIGTISKVDDDSYVMVEITKDVQVKVVRSTISGLVKDEKTKA